jgi:hypothetical protein
VGRAFAVGLDLGVGVSLGMGLAVTVAVGVAVGVAVTVAVGVEVAVAVGVGEAVTVGVGVGEVVAVGVGETVPVGVGVGVGADSMVRKTSFVSYVTCAVTPAGAVIETFANVVPFRPPVPVNRVYCIPTINGPPVSVTSNSPSSAAVPLTITLSAVSGVMVDHMNAVESQVRSPLIEMTWSGASMP